MALIDVSELMLDPDFISTFSIIRRTPTINNYGENVLSETTISNVKGSIQAVGKETAERLPEGINLKDFLTVFTKTPVFADKENGYPDIIVWEGLRYQVYQVLPWSNFGAGWYMVDCQLERKTL